MSGGAGKGDIASFATDVGGGKTASRGLGLAGQAPGLRRRPRQAVRLREPRRLGLPRHADRQQGRQRDRRRPRRRQAVRRRRPRHARRRPGQRRLQGGQGADDLLRQGKAAARLRLRPARPDAGRRRRPRRSSAAPARDHFVVAFDEASETFEVSARKGLAIGAGCARPGGAPDRVACPADGPGRWLMADLGPGNDSLEVERLAAGGRQRPPRRQLRQRHRSKAGPRTT